MAHEDVVTNIDPTQPSPSDNEGFVVTSARPKEKKCRIIKIKRMGTELSDWIVGQKKGKKAIDFFIVGIDIFYE